MRENILSYMSCKLKDCLLSYDLFNWKSFFPQSFFSIIDVLIQRIKKYDYHHVHQ